MTFRAGDVVFHEPSGEQWILACDEERGEVMPAGWPETYAKAADCELREAATDENRIDWLTRASGGSGREYSRRRSLARHQLSQAQAPTEPKEQP